VRWNADASYKIIEKNGFDDLIAKAEEKALAAAIG